MAPFDSETEENLRQGHKTNAEVRTHLVAHYRRDCQNPKGYSPTMGNQSSRTAKYLPESP